MAKVLGVMLTLVGFLASLGNLFLYLNSSANLAYNPADTSKGLLDVGIAAQTIFWAFILVAGILLLRFSNEPEVK